MDSLRTSKANKGIIVTSSYFSPEALAREKEEKGLLDLKNHNDIALWACKYVGK